MNNAAAKVGDIYREAGIAFSKLSEMVLLLQPDGQSKSKLTDEEVEALRSCVHSFAMDLNKVSQHIKNRTVTQIRTTLKKKAFEDAGITVRQVSSTATSHSQQSAPPHQVTLNMLNASENEVDVDGINNDVKLEFEHGNDEVTT